ncbi:hypothetical protein AVEN_15148-1 [Araneus ventricosus]|uniref:Uncharacterized protein n=1 Tax=Araneus ventricosus TaxID=182803 RepID=A0A4Y2WGS2_ARAVE|nr:hypothetical protein AVEN_15148-1 [Araneus ventricosus]
MYYKFMNSAYVTMWGKNFFVLFVIFIIPCIDLQEMESVLADFEKQWEQGNFPGWQKETESALTHSGAHLDLSAFSSWEGKFQLGSVRMPHFLGESKDSYKSDTSLCSKDHEDVQSLVQSSKKCLPKVRNTRK